ncbi:hypothetical protein LCGC14_3161330, partial [marine sediment metagenome]
MKYRSLKHWKYELLVEEFVEVSLHLLEPIITSYIILGKTLTPNGCKLTVNARYAWDGPSGPTFDTPTNMRASLFHDALCQLMAEDLLDRMYRKYADELLRTHMLEDQLKDADGLLVIYGANGSILYQAKKKKGLKRAIYLRWGRFRANG